MTTGFLRAAIAGGLAASLITALVPARAQAVDRTNAPTIATVGCLDGDPDSLRFEDPSGVYRLTGNTAAIAPFIGQAVTITGVPHRRWLSTPGRTIEVIQGAAAATPPAAALDPVLGDPAHWRSLVNHHYGLSVEFPGEPSSNNGPGPRPRLPLNDDIATIHRSTIPPAIFPGSDFAGGKLAIFADSEIANAEKCAAASPHSGGGAPPSANTLTIAGIDYSAQPAAASEPNSPQPTEYLRTFHNGICYEFAFRFVLATREDYGAMDCMVRGADPSQLARLIVSEVSFFPPEMKTAHK